ncbi:MAG: hypothetical protein IJZ06_07975 [Bacteroidales bacterium]|nr:hypothetical protein [Bacteroidales bacterium]
MAGTGAGFGKWDLGAGRSGEQRYSGKPDGVAGTPRKSQQTLPTMIVVAYRIRQI